MGRTVLTSVYIVVRLVGQWSCRNSPLAGEASLLPPRRSSSLKSFYLFFPWQPKHIHTGTKDLFVFRAIFYLYQKTKYYSIKRKQLDVSKRKVLLKLN